MCLVVMMMVILQSLEMLVMISYFVPTFHCQFSVEPGQVNVNNANKNNDKEAKQMSTMPSKCQQYQAQCQQAAYRVPIVRLPQMHADLIRARYLQNTQYKQPTTGQCGENSHKNLPKPLSANNCSVAILQETKI